MTAIARAARRGASKAGGAAAAAPTAPAALAAIAAAASGVALLATSGWLIARAAERPGILTLMVAIVAVRTFGLARAGFRYVERLRGHDAGLRAQAELRVRMYRKLETLVPQGLPLATDRTVDAELPGRSGDPKPPRSGDLLARLVSDTDAAVDGLVRVTLPLAAAAATGAASAALLALLAPALGGLVALMVGLSLLAVPPVVRLAGRLADRRIAPLHGELGAAVAETLEALPELVAYDATATALERIERIDTRLRRAESRASWARGLGGALVWLLVGAGCLAALGFGVPEARSSGSVVLLAVLVLTPLALADVLAVIPAAASAAGEAHGARARIAALQGIPPAIVELEPVGAMEVEPGAAVAYRMSVEGVRARGLASNPNPRGLSLELRTGRRVALVGPSGSGKTSVTHLLTRLLEYDEGRITLQGRDLRAYDGDTIRRVVGLCEQEAYVFDTTLRENLRLARPNATDADLLDALTRAGLRTWIASLPAGLDTFVGEHGEAISGGERRRLAVARMLLADPPIVLYDEPTEHLDDPTADRVLRELLGSTAGKAILIATHRPIPATLVDQVVRLDDPPA